jgi:pimeloyl-ACP methyl ester carboxylesterase
VTEQRICRDIVAIGERQVHFRHAGDGPPLLLLHQSPRSSAELVPLMQFLAPHFLVIAPDTPGCGLSDPLQPADAEPTIDAFVDSIVTLLDALGIARAAVFGSHTGAIFGVRLASRYPDRVAALVANGIMLATPEDRAEQTDRYFPRFVPQWDGSHLAWMWSRLRDQLVFYPWYQRDPVHRINWAQTLEEIDAGALDLLQAGDNYRGAYHAVVSYAIGEDLPFLETPTLLLVARQDALSRYVDDYPPLPAGVEVLVVPDFGDIPGAASAFLTRYAPPPARIAKSAVSVRRSLSSSFMDLGSGSLHLQSSSARQGAPLLVLHDLGSSATDLDAMLGGAVGRRPLLVPDLPGNGDSDDFGAVAPADMARVMLKMLEALCVESFDIVAVGASAAVALALREAAPGKSGAVLFAEPTIVPAGADASFARRLVPDLTPDIAGSHLTRAWMFLRDRELFFPWDDRSAEGIIGSARPSRPVELQRGLISLLKSRRVLAAQLEAVLREGTGERLVASGSTMLATAGAPTRRHGFRFDSLPDDRVQWGPALLRALARVHASTSR